MKTEYKLTAMRCTQEQFDSIKDRVTLPIENIGSFEVFEYLVLRDYYVTNITKEAIYENMETYETFNGELFLDCCGRESNKCEYKLWYANKLNKKVSELDEYDLHCVNVIKEYIKDKVWEGSEIKANFGNGWEDVFSGYKYRIKPQPNDNDLFEQIHKQQIIDEYIKDKVWLRNELQFELDGKWYDSSQEYKIRVKTHPDYTAEIEALERKAKENGKKVIIKFEEL